MQTQDALDSMLIFKSPIENEWNAHCYILAIQFYLGYFETDDNNIH